MAMMRPRLAAIVLAGLGIAALSLSPITANGQRRAPPAGAATPAPSDLEAALAESWPEARLPEPRAAWAGRLKQDSVMRLCSQFRGRPPTRVAAALQKQALATVQFPADGNVIGDWRRGEAIAQSGYGQRFTDIDAQPGPGAARPNGGNCYACHQLSPGEFSHGTLGPSLTGYGRLHDFSAEAAIKVYVQIWNPHARTPCSNMPRFGAGGTLTTEQIKDLVALLVARDSPVNK